MAISKKVSDRLVQPLKKYQSILLLILLSSCAATPEMASQKSDMDVCKQFGAANNLSLLSGQKDVYHDELLKRNLIKDNEWPIVHANKIRMGMSQCALYASWGIPDRENKSTGSWGTKTQHVFGKRNYVYTENGKVTSWQN